MKGAGSETFTGSLVEGLHAIAPEDWDCCAGGNNPFISHGFLAALEDSGCIGGETGWIAYHLILNDEAGRIRGCMPLYVKLHSMGEYVFDHGWARAFEQAGGAYYPKLLCAVPFTPVTGPRLLVGTRDPAREVIQRALLDTLADLPDRMGFSSAHINFVEDAENLLGVQQGWLGRTGLQYHWYNAGYEDFAEFLGALSSRKRKKIRKERKQAGDGVSIHTLQGDDIRACHWDAFFAFYQDTGLRKWGRPYLNRSFFDLLGRYLGERVVLVMAQDSGRWIAGALNLLGSDALYGRYWGCLASHPALHFELCYYQAIEYAIRHGLSRVEAGAQGEHKIERGYVGMPTHSLHQIRHSGLREAIIEFLNFETHAIGGVIEETRELSPFRRTGS